MDNDFVISCTLESCRSLFEYFELCLLGIMRCEENTMANIIVLPDDVFLYILKYLDMEERIAFALTCWRFKQLCMDANVFRKMDLSRHAVSTTQRGAVNTFFRDRPLTQHVTELNVSNLRVLNWQMDDQLQEFIVSICPHLKALHVVNCGMSFQRLHHILKEAPKLMALSWSLWDFTSEDLLYFLNNIKLCKEFFLKNIRYLHLETSQSLIHIQIVTYLVLSCCRDLEELEISTWLQIYYTGHNLPLSRCNMFPDFPRPSVKNKLQHLHSLMVVAVGNSPLATFKKMLSKFVVSILRRKSNSTKWKKFWILPTIGISRKHLTDLSLLLHPDDFQSVEEIVTNPGQSDNTVDEVKSFFERIGDKAVRSLHLCLPNRSNRIVEFCDPISRVGGHSLRFLSLSVFPFDVIPVDQNVVFHKLFSNCMNITELDLLYFFFEKDICEHLSKLKHLTKVQLMQCAISSKYNRENQVEISKANLVTFVENCKNITHLDVRGCGRHARLSCRLTDDHLLPLSKLRKLKSLTLYNISGITEWTFLQNISEHCKFLTTLRITAMEYFNNSRIPILMESAKFLRHLAISVRVPLVGSEVFWNLLRHAKNLERLCITIYCQDSLNIPLAVETLKSLPRLHVLYLDAWNVGDDVFCDEMIKMLEGNKSDCRFSFEIVTRKRRNTWINQETGHTLISNTVFPLNEAELDVMRPILDIPRL